MAQASKHYIFSFWGNPEPEFPHGRLLRTQRARSLAEVGGRAVIDQRPRGCVKITRITVGFRSRTNVNFWDARDQL